MLYVKVHLINLHINIPLHVTSCVVLHRCITLLSHYTVSCHSVFLHYHIMFNYIGLYYIAAYLSPTVFVLKCYHGELCMWHVFLCFPSHYKQVSNFISLTRLTSINTTRSLPNTPFEQ